MTVRVPRFIRNRKDQKISVLAEGAGDKLAFVMHGLGGFKEDEHIAGMARCFVDAGFTVVRFDTTNTLGESDGKFEDATITNYYEDLEDVIDWASTQDWFKSPFALAGHSLGGFCTALYAQRHPSEVSMLAPISTVVSGQLSVEAHERYEPEAFAAWKKTGWKVEESRSKPGIIKRLPWSHIEDRLTYDLMQDIASLTMPVLLVVGENDTSTPPDHVKIFHDALSGPKELHVVPGAPHTFRDAPYLGIVKAVISEWIGKHA